MTDEELQEALKRILAKPYWTEKELNTAVDALYNQYFQENEEEFEKLVKVEELKMQQKVEEFERQMELREQQEEEELERLEELRDQQEDEEFERREELRMQREEEEEEDDEDEQWQQSNGSNVDSSRFDYSDGSRIVDFEDYSEADPNDYDPSEVDGGPDNEDEYFDTGEEDDDY